MDGRQERRDGLSMNTALTRRARRRHNPRRSAILPLLTAAGAGAGYNALILMAAPADRDAWTRMLNDQGTKGDFLARIVLPLGGAIAWALATNSLGSGLAFGLGEAAAILATGGNLAAVAGDTIDLGPYDANGFAWNRRENRVYTIRERTYVGGATTRDEAVAVARAWFA